MHLITHAALHIPRPLVAESAEGGARARHLHPPERWTVLDLDYLDLLEGHAVIDHATLQKKTARAAAATKIVDDAVAPARAP